MTNTTPSWLSNVAPLDTTTLAVRADEAAFLKQQTGIQDDEQLRKHILSVQEKAYRVYPYPCILHFVFISLQISKLPMYQHVLRLGKERQDALFLDVGCCLGNDARKLAADGFPALQIIATDCQPAFWALGNELFNTSDAECGIRFIQGDIFDDPHLDPNAEVQAFPASLDTLRNLTPLAGHVSAIYASSLFHLFTEEQQTTLARRLSALIKPQAGSVLFGLHIAAERCGTINWRRREYTMTAYCHSPESWAALWHAVCSERGFRVEVKATLLKTTRDFQIVGENGCFMEWQVVVV